MKTPDFRRHPLSAAYGDADPEMFKRLQVSIAAGFDEREPILLYEDMILDGWNRYMAGKGLVPLTFEKFSGSREEAIALVKRKNYRRNLTAGQLVAIELEIEAYRPEPGSGTPRTDEQVAADLGVTDRTVRQFRAVQRNAIPAVVEAVKAGDVSVKKAEQIAKLPKSEQKDAIATPRDRSHERPSAPKVKVAKPEVGASKEALAELEERNSILAEEHDRLLLRVGLDASEYTDDERAIVETTVAELKATIAQLEHEVAVLKDSRDTYMREVRELTRQCAMYRNQLVAKKRA